MKVTGQGKERRGQGGGVAAAEGGRDAGMPR